MKRQTLAALIAAAFALAACNDDNKQAATQPAGESSTPAAQTASAAPEAPAQSAEADVPVDQLPVIDAVTTHAPEVPPPVNRDHAALVKVKMETVEKTMKMADGVDYTY